MSVLELAMIGIALTAGYVLGRFEQRDLDTAILRTYEAAVKARGRSEEAAA